MEFYPAVLRREKTYFQCKSVFLFIYLGYIYAACSEPHSKWLTIKF